MATRKPSGGQRPKSKSAKPVPKLTKNQAELKVLKAAGLFKGDWRKAKVASGAQKRLRKQYADEIPLLADGRARAIKVPKKDKDGKRLTNAVGQKVHNNRVIVRAEKGERFHYDKKTGQVTSFIYREGIKYRRRIFAGDVQSIQDLPRGKKLRYLVPFRQWGMDSPLFESPEELAKFMADYEAKRFKDWLDFVEILELIDKDTFEDLFDA